MSQYKEKDDMKDLEAGFASDTNEANLLSSSSDLPVVTPPKMSRGKLCLIRCVTIPFLLLFLCTIAVYFLGLISPETLASIILLGLKKDVFDEQQRLDFINDIGGNYVLLGLQYTNVICISSGISFLFKYRALRSGKFLDKGYTKQEYRSLLKKLVITFVCSALANIGLYFRGKHFNIPSDNPLWIFAFTAESFVYFGICFVGGFLLEFFIQKYNWDKKRQSIGSVKI